ncbi:2,4-dihydroxyhept-2-ene-1,7-dioic acid aldolase [bacterium]|nr:MAG: 2,4-dihydroxyhept-2-ene-1,7-dioic acid aldolase [bacterium]
MRNNRLQQLWREGGAAVNGWLTIPSSFSAEVMAHAGWTSITVDMQHGLVDYQTMVTMLQAISTTEAVPLVRVPWNDPGIIMKSLDAGAFGVICPMVNSREEAERLVGACKYPPAGYRSSGPVRAALYCGADYQEHANTSVLAFAMIETKTAVERLDEILSTPGLDAVYLGPADLSFSLTGKFGFDHAEGTICYNAIETILAACKRHGVVAGIHTGSPEYAAKMIGLGFQFVSIGSDAKLLAGTAGDAVARVRAIRDGKHEPASATSSAPY